MATHDEGDFWGTNKGDQSKRSGKKGGDGSGGTPEGGFWSNAGPGASPPRSNPPSGPESGGADFWNKAEEKRQHDAKIASMSGDEQKRLRKRRRRKILLISFGSLLLLLVLLVVLTPTIAGWVAPGIVESQASKQIVGRVQVEKASFGWLGPQRIQKFKLLDKEGKLVATASVEAQTGLFGLIRGNLNLGTITLEGVKADIVKYEDGTTNIEKAVAPRQAAKPSKPAPSTKTEEIRIPDSLHAKVIAKNMQITFTDLTRPGASPGVPTVSVSNADLEAQVGAGDPLVLNLTAKAAPGGGSPGSISVDVKADKLIRNDGLVQPTKATVDADVTLAQFPLALADAFVSLPENASVRQALGETIDVDVVAKGSLSDATAQLRANSEHLKATGDVKVANGVLTTPSPLNVSINGQAIRTLAPQIDASLKGQDQATIEAFPNVTLAVANLKMPVPDGRDLDLRGASAEITLNLTETRGTVKLSGDRAEPFRIDPLEAKVLAPDLSQGARLTAATKASINGQPAGDLNVDVTVAGILDAKGAPVQGPPGTIQGTVAVRKIATAIAQPFLETTGINLPQEIGPTLDIEAKANTDMRGLAAGATPPTDVTIAVASEALKVNGGVQLSQAEIRSTAEGLKVEVKRPAQIASHFVDASTGFQVTPTTEQGRQQGLVMTLKNLVVPRNVADGQLLLDKAGADLEVAVSGIVLAPVGEASPAAATPRAGQAAPAQTAALAINNTVITSQLSPGGSAKLVMNAAMAYGGDGFTSKADFVIPNMIVVTEGKPGMAPPAQLRPVGKFELREVPTALTKLFIKPAAPTSPDDKPIDLAKLLGDTLGPAVTVQMTTAQVQGSNEALNALIAMKSATTIAEVNADVGQTQLALKKLAVQASVTPQTVTGLTQAFAPNVAGVPRLVGPSRIIVQVDPLVVPMRDYQPMLDRAGTLGARITIPGRTLIEGLQVANEDGTKRDLGRVGVDSLDIAAKVPIAAVMGEALPEERKVTATLAGTIMGSAEEALLELSGNLATEINNRKLAGGMTSDLKLNRINTKLLEQLAGKPGMISGAIGGSLSAQLATNTTPPRDAKGGFDFTQASTDLQLTLEAPRLKSDGPIRANIAPVGVSLTKPVKLVMDVDPVWLNRFFEKPRPANVIAGPVQHDIKLTRETSVTLTLNKLSHPMNGNSPAGQLPAEVGIGLSIPQLQFVDSDNREIQMKQLVAAVDATPIKQGTAYNSDVPINVKLDVAETMVVGVDSSAKTMTLRALVEGLLGSNGQVTTESAAVTLNGDLPAVPTAIIDSLARQEGLIVDALGPIASVKVEVQRFPLGQMKPGAKPSGSPPVVSATAESQRAKANLRGTIRDNVFVSEAPLEVTIMELTEELSKRLVKMLPLFGTVSKSPKDAPALVVGTNLTVPLGNDMTKLNGEFRIDPGEARFNTSEGFAKLLKGVNAQQSGVVGQKLQPINARIVSGVATYDRWTVPLGEFEIQTEGTVDLVKRHIDVVTYVPFSHLSESAAGALNTNLNSVLGRAGGTLVNAATTVPIRTSGPMDKPTTGIDSKAFAENLRKNLKPEDLIKEGLGDLLKDQLQPKK